MKTAQNQRVRAWIKRNWGVIDKVARQCNVTNQYVQAVAYGKSVSEDNKVAATLRSKGWPGAKEKNNAQVS